MSIKAGDTEMKGAGCQKISVEIHAEIKGEPISVPIQWVTIQHIFWARRPIGEITALSVVFVVKVSKVVHSLVKKDLKVAEVWYRDEPFTYPGPDSPCEHCGRWGDIKTYCSGKPMFGYSSGPPRKGDHQSDMVGYNAEQGPICGPTQEK
jgi:hypothetical protein